MAGSAFTQISVTLTPEDGALLGNDMPRRIPTHKPVTSSAGTRARTKQDEAKALRSQYKWIKCSQAGRKREPLCCDPFGVHGERVEQAEHRHHIKPLAERPDLLLDPGNHASLCGNCHHRIEAMVRAGKPTEHFFEGEKRAHPLTQFFAAMGGARTVEFSEKPPTLEEAQSIVGGTVQMLTVSEERQLLFNEEGRILRLRPNPTASLLADQPIVGDALLLKGSAKWH